MSKDKIKLAIVGVGKIVQDQHLPSIEQLENYQLVATASRNGAVEGVRAYTRIESMLDAESELQAVALCMPPQYRFAAAQLALSKGLHVLLEKPPGASVSEVEQLQRLAAQNGVSLYATWHSRHAAAVQEAKCLLAEQSILSVRLTWREDVCKWHPGQQWIWQAGGLGVFDPGINGLSILSHVLPETVRVTGAQLSFPSNKAAPIAASIQLATASGAAVVAEMDWRARSDEVWNIEIATKASSLVISEGGAKLSVDGKPIELTASANPHQYREYIGIYRRFAELIENAESDVDLTPLKLVADAFLLADRKIVEPFSD